LEGNGKLDEGITFYKKAEDYLSVVRVYCFAEDHDSAAEIVRQSQDRSAAFHLARSLESAATEQTDLTEDELISKLRLSIHYYQFSGQYRHALRLAIHIDAEQDILSIAMQVVDDSVVLNDAATYFEERGMIDRAVMMYQKGGNVSRAVEMCIEGKLFDVLTELVTKMDENSDPVILRRCAAYFMDNLEYGKTVDLLVLSGEFDQALTICEERNVHLSDEFVEKITPPKTDNPIENERRVQTLRKLGELAQRQGNFHLATKKFTQAGDKLLAMRCLLQSGDTDRIVFFANVSKQKEIYILAANYLQNLNWRDDAKVMKQIVTFYVKAKALENVAGFYDACAQVEIDDYRAYDKALSALREAEKYLGKARIHGKEAKLSALQEKIHLMERFINARELVKTHPEDMIRTCEDLLRERDIDRAVRTGDIYALLVEFHHGNGNMEEAYQIIERMRDRGIDLSFYLDADMTRTIHSRMGIEIDAVDDRDAISEEIIDEELDEELLNEDV
jgi:intraflagellar transport protein 140